MLVEKVKSSQRRMDRFRVRIICVVLKCMHNSLLRCAAEVNAAGTAAEVAAHVEGPPLSLAEARACKAAACLCSTIPRVDS